MVIVVVPPLSVPEPRTAVPFLNVTDPLGEGSPKLVFVEVTVTVNVTESPTLAGFLDETTAVLVETLFTV